mmetsp:Transcript_48433/g.89846  ORF Transcript_48433/g.89846 Transcript_48433/m.89846 type:complete len:208 (+) Transcript_48433:606-1229(+)
MPRTRDPLQSAPPAIPGINAMNRIGAGTTNTVVWLELLLRHYGSSSLHGLSPPAFFSVTVAIAGVVRPCRRRGRINGSTSSSSSTAIDRSFGGPSLIIMFVVVIGPSLILVLVLHLVVLLGPFQEGGRTGRSEPAAFQHPRFVSNRGGGGVTFVVYLIIDVRGLSGADDAGPRSDAAGASVAQGVEFVLLKERCCAVACEDAVVDRQ